MPYVVTWEDPEQKVGTIRFQDPIDQADVDRLRDELMPSLSEDRALRLLIDLRAAGISALVTLAVNNLDAILPQNLSFHLKHSRVAILGGGTAIQLILSLTSSISGGANLTQFEDENAANEWLR